MRRKWGGMSLATSFNTNNPKWSFISPNNTSLPLSANVSLKKANTPLQRVVYTNLKEMIIPWKLVGNHLKWFSKTSKIALKWKDHPL